VNTKFTLRCTRRLQLNHRVELVAGSMFVAEAHTAAALIAQGAATLAYAGDRGRLKDVLTLTRPRPADAA
jgi:hypothetical protein